METHAIHMNRSYGFGATLMAVCIFLQAHYAAAQGLSPYTVFQAMSLEELKTLQVKLTYVGPQQDITPSVGFTSTFNKLDLNLFVAFRRPGLNYNNDDLAVQTFTASPAELQALIQHVGTLPNVVSGGVSGEVLSFALLNTSGGTKAFEAVLGKSDSIDLLAKLRLALATNKTGLRRLSELACPLALLEPTRPTDVLSQVSVTMSGVRLNRTTGRYVGSATVRNNASDLLGPVSLVLDLSGSVILSNADGTTCGTEPVGRAFINLPLTNNTLPAGASVMIGLEFENPNNEPVQATAKVLAGPGAR